jgi:glycine cleavage system transcriptional repressor
MQKFAVLTAIGGDRPGLVDKVSRFILQCGCNVEDSRMAILGGEFAMLIQVSGEEAAIEKLLQGATGEGHRAGLSLQAHPTTGPDGVPRADSIPYQVTAYSMDHPGIVQRVSHFLAEREINIRALDTHLSYAPHTGQPLFSLQALVDVPAAANVAEIRRGLEAIGAEENIDIQIKPAAPTA